eukprot:3887668-Alexandrium_andersonii.AAC.1
MTLRRPHGQGEHREARAEQQEPSKKMGNLASAHKADEWAHGTQHHPTVTTQGAYRRNRGAIELGSWALRGGGRPRDRGKEQPGRRP